MRDRRTPISSSARSSNSTLRSGPGWKATSISRSSTLKTTGTPTMDACIGDFWVHKPQEPTSYGNRYQLKDIVCDVEETGVTCTNPEGHGFTVNRAAFAPFLPKST